MNNIEEKENCRQTHCKTTQKGLETLAPPKAITQLQSTREDNAMQGKHSEQPEGSLSSEGPYEAGSWRQEAVGLHWTLHNGIHPF